MTRAAIALGSNLGDRLDSLRFGARALTGLGTLISASSVYETAPIGGPEQDPFYNAVVVLDTRLGPQELLDELHRIEAEAGRVREVRWGPRLLDLDLILYGSQRAEGGGMVVPHPRFAERRFVLEPLLEAWPEATTPDGRPIAPLLASVLNQEVTRMGTWWPEQPDRPSPDERVDSPSGPVGVDEASGATFAGRGGWWVVAQFVFFGVVVTGAGAFPDTMAAGWWMRALGVALMLLGALQGGFGLLHLGVSLTPYPEPLELGDLVHGGMYRHVRHPVYGGLALGMVGIALFQYSWPGLAAALATGVFFWFKAGAEERRLLARYPGYQDYRSRTRARMIAWIL